MDFMQFLKRWQILSGVSRAVAGLTRNLQRLQLGCLGVYSLSQGFARFEMRHATFRDRNALATAGIAAHAGRAVVDRKAAKTTDFNTLATHERIVHGVQNSLDGELCVVVRPLAEPVRQFFYKVRAGHGSRIRGDKKTTGAQGNRPFLGFNEAV
jgi:hypothetical protein